MKHSIVNAREYGILPNIKECQKEQLSKLFLNIMDNSTIVFEPGTYQMDCQFLLENKKNLTICGDKTQFISHYDTQMKVADTPGLFLFRGCENLIIRDIEVTTDYPANTTGHVISKDIEGGTYVFRPMSGFAISGQERIMAQNSFDEELTPDYHLFCYEKNLYDVLENGDIRIHLTEEPQEQLKRLQVGQLVSLRHIVYGKEFFIFENCNHVTLEDITVFSSPGPTVRVLPRCSDFTFERFCVKRPENSHILFAANADGLHIKGVTGKLVLKDCYFEHLGDDALNIHSRAALVTNVETKENSLDCISGWEREPLSHHWAEAGDVIEVYHPKEFLVKAKLLVKAYCDGKLTYEVLEGNVVEGDVLANTAYFASVHVDNCTVRNSRARGILIQSRDVVIENSTFFGLSLAGVLISPDIEYWYEVGPARNVRIQNNIFKKCAYAGAVHNLGTILVKSSHGSEYEAYPCGVHQNLVIKDNQFVDSAVSAVFVSSTEGVEVTNNTFKHCCFEHRAEELPGSNNNIELQNCSNIIVENNYEE